MRKACSVGVIAWRNGLGSARVSRAGFGVAPKQSFDSISQAVVVQKKNKFAIARTSSPTRGTRALPMSDSSLFLHNEHQRADKRGSQKHSHALQRPYVSGHQYLADLPHC